MTGAEFSAALRELHLPHKAFAARAGVTPEAVSRWAQGHNAVPVWASWIVELLRDRIGPDTTGVRWAEPRDLDAEGGER